MSSQPTTPDSTTVDEELVSYLDGELDAATRALVERRLADDEAFRTRLRLLQRTWDALDVLGRTDPDEAFTRTTVELVAIKAAEDAEYEQERQTRRRTWSWMGWGIGVIVVASAGWLVTGHLLTQPDRDLVRDLPLIERVDEYRNAESIEFVKALDQSGLFASEIDNER